MYLDLSCFSYALTLSSILVFLEFLDFLLLFLLDYLFLLFFSSFSIFAISRFSSSFILSIFSSSGLSRLSISRLSGIDVLYVTIYQIYSQEVTKQRFDAIFKIMRYVIYIYIYLMILKNASKRCISHFSRIDLVGTLVPNFSYNFATF